MPYSKQHQHVMQVNHDLPIGFSLSTSVGGVNLTVAWQSIHHIGAHLLRVKQSTCQPYPYQKFVCQAR